MANYIVICDLTGPYPSPRQMEAHLAQTAALRGRVMATVWWVEYPGSAEQLMKRARTLLGGEDLLVVIEAKAAAWSRRDEALPVPGQAA
jgi:hypothetical protein